MRHRQGMETLRQDGWRRVAQGKTTIEEVVRVTQTDEVMAETTETDRQWRVARTPVAVRVNALRAEGAAKGDADSSPVSR